MTEELSDYLENTLITKDLPNEFKRKIEYMKNIYERIWNKKYSDKEVIFFTGTAKYLEIEYLKNTKNSLTIVNIDSKNQLRFERTKKRQKKDEENITIAKIVEIDNHRNGIPNNYKNNNLQKIIDYAEYTIKNNKNISNLHKEVNTLLKWLKENKKYDI